MAENGADDDQRQEMISMSGMRHKRRHMSQIPTPSHGLILKQVPEGYITMSAVRKRRMLSEQISLHDR
jgi:hypothetical protein